VGDHIHPLLEGIWAISIRSKILINHIHPPLEGDHIHPPLEGMWATSTGSEIHIMTPPGGPVS